MTDGPGAQPAYGMQLRLSDQKPPALHNGGYIDYGPAGGSYYYSRTRLAVDGALSTPGGPTFQVESSGQWPWGFHIGGRRSGERGPELGGQLGLLVAHVAGRDT
jgi:hypothetical protein